MYSPYNGRDVIDIIVPTLQRIQSDLAAMRGHLSSIDGRLDGLDSKVESGFARIDERFDLVNGRFLTLENAVVDMSARIHVLGLRVDRDRDEVRARLATLEVPPGR